VLEHQTAGRVGVARLDSLDSLDSLEDLAVSSETLAGLLDLDLAPDT